MTRALADVSGPTHTLHSHALLTLLQSESAPYTTQSCEESNAKLLVPWISGRWAKTFRPLYAKTRIGWKFATTFMWRFTNAEINVKLIF